VKQKDGLPALRVGARTHQGKVRSENQDRMGRFLSPIGELYIVADGMGGHEGGATAAAMAIDGFDAHLKQVPAGTPPGDALQQAAARTNAEIYRAANSGDPRTAKMGATVVLGLLRDGELLIGHAGDSRAYLFRDGRLLRLTRDHSVVQKMIDHHMLTEEEARDHPDSSVITRALGQKPDFELELSEPLALRPGDGLLLCSDGLCGYVDDAAIEEIVSRHDEAQEVTDALIEAALAAGGEDNVTVQFLQYGPREGASEGGATDEATQKKQQQSLLAFITSPAALALLAAGLLLLVALGLFGRGIIAGWRDRLFPAQPEKATEGKSTGQSDDRSHGPNKPAAELSPRNHTVAPRQEQQPDAKPQTTAGTEGTRRKRLGIAVSASSSLEELLPDWDIEAVAVPPREVRGYLKSRCVYYRKEAEAEAQRLAAQLGYSAEEISDDLMKQVGAYEIIVSP
jgi:protein phosphatase